MNLLDTKYLLITWSPKRPGGRRFKYRHIRRVHSIYVQVLALETVVWYK